MSSPFALFSIALWATVSCLTLGAFCALLYLVLASTLEIGAFYPALLIYGVASVCALLRFPFFSVEGRRRPRSAIYSAQLLNASVVIACLIAACLRLEALWLSINANRSGWFKGAIVFGVAAVVNEFWWRRKNPPEHECARRLTGYE